ncbi:ankyrin repeat and SOCS box protein 14-like [Liolophura sinensis]|uniref:ankyrin repeat and SOCS box protein 14-like n=1 Tax=Liolophura sinensis TaxID=3198878 RepID=UPI00315968E9
MKEALELKTFFTSAQVVWTDIRVTFTSINQSWSRALQEAHSGGDIHPGRVEWLSRRKGGFKAAVEVVKGMRQPCAVPHFRMPVNVMNILATMNNEAFRFNREATYKAGAFHTQVNLYDIVDVLLECGLGQTESNQFKQNALMVASKKGHAAIVNRLLDAVECSDRFGYTPLMYAVVEGHIDVVKLLLERGCDPLSRRWSAKDTALHFAASYGHVEITALLLEYISDPDIPDCIGITPLYLAAEEGHLNVVEILAPKCDLYSMCGDKGRPLDAAVEYGHLDCLKYFLEHGDTVMIKDNNGRTPLMKAACRGHVDMVKFLLDRASDISAEDDLGKTALSYAVLSMNPKCVEVLLSAGASVGIVDSDGVALLMVAIKVGQPAIVSLFILAGADLERKWRVNRALDPLYPLELAVKQENFEVVQLLVNAGCTISMEDITNHWNRMEFESGVGYRLHPLPGQSGSTMSLTNDNEAVRSYLKKHAAKPYPLKCHCRKAIWKSLPKPYWCSVGDLPIPNLIKDYLLMAESNSPALQK